MVFAPTLLKGRLVKQAGEEGSIFSQASLEAGVEIGGWLFSPMLPLPTGAQTGCATRQDGHPEVNRTQEMTD